MLDFWKSLVVKGTYVVFYKGEIVYRIHKYNKNVWKVESCSSLLPLTQEATCKTLKEAKDTCYTLLTSSKTLD